MRLQDHSWSCLVSFLLLLLATGQLNALGHARTVNREVERWKSKYSAPPMGYFSNRSPPSKQDEQDDFSPIYGVSKRFVPQGPNPLHN
ncbi:hypothetical protein ZIOFF_010395 [Zingiber officinale]|uniref:Uncharacterized protein n=1 Tax=Zingiber officinale TaxID=94328 RepID=A0A8J5LZG9_ZINOF|nr:hypothetical protein ZIOFF_010395 [Zingiber officinale]